MRNTVVIMKRYIKSTTDKKFPVFSFPESEWQDRLHIPVSEVRDLVLSNVSNTQDKEIFQYLIDNKVFPTIVTSSDMRNNPYYDQDDKLIDLVSTEDDCRVYYVPYPGTGRFGTGKIYVQTITIYDGGSIQFGKGKIRDVDHFAVSTLKSDFYRN